MPYLLLPYLYISLSYIAPITLIDNKHFKITVAEVGAYEKFKLDNKAKIDAAGLKGRLRPYFNPELVESIE